jgi:hypothetical protein
MKDFIIRLDPNGLTGVGVETNEQQMDKVWADIPQHYPQQTYKDLADALRKSLKAMLPSIVKNGYATDVYGEFYSKEIFDTDLMYLAAYDYIGYGKGISIQQPA